MSKLADYILERNPEHADLVRWLDQDPDYLPADVRAILRARTEHALCILAHPYADEPDFDESWRL